MKENALSFKFYQLKTLKKIFVRKWDIKMEEKLKHWLFIFFFFFFFCRTQGLHLEPLHQPFFVMGVFKIVFLKQFAQAGFKLRSSWSLLPE
jgi:hypothetical protein